MGLGLGKEWIMLAKGTISRVALGQGSATAAGVLLGLQELLVMGLLSALPLKRPPPFGG